MSKSRTDCMKYQKIVKMAKRLFFDNKIQENMLFNKGPWDKLGQKLQITSYEGHQVQQFSIQSFRLSVKHIIPILQFCSKLFH